MARLKTVGTNGKGSEARLCDSAACLRRSAAQLRKSTAELRGSAAGFGWVARPEVLRRAWQCLRGEPRPSEYLRACHHVPPDRIDAPVGSTRRVVAGTNGPHASAVPSFRIFVSFSRDAVITRSERMLGWS
jgi:hypothetical protein